MLLLFVISFTSCDTETDAPLVAKEFSIEYVTLSEYNSIMSQYGLKEVTEEEVSKSVKNRSVLPCATWVNHGDWNQSNSFSTLDIVYAQQWLCANPGCSGYEDTSNCSYCPGVSIDFSQLSNFVGNGTDFILNSDDLETARDFILGRIACN